MEPFLTPKQAAEQKGVSLSTIYSAIERGQIPTTRIMDRLAIRAADLEAYQPGSYGGIKRTIRQRGPGRVKAEADAA